MKTNNFNTNPFYQMEYDEEHESHEQHSDITESTLTFYDWYEHKLDIYSEDAVRTQILKQSYYKILEYKIHQSSVGIELQDFQLIMHVNNLVTSFCRQCNLY